MSSRIRTDAETPAIKAFYGLTRIPRGAIVHLLVLEVNSVVIPWTEGRSRSSRTWTKREGTCGTWEGERSDLLLV